MRLRSRRVAIPVAAALSLTLVGGACSSKTTMSDGWTNSIFTVLFTKPCGRTISSSAGVADLIPIRGSVTDTKSGCHSRISHFNTVSPMCRNTNPVSRPRKLAAIFREAPAGTDARRSITVTFASTGLYAVYVVT